MVVDGGEVKDVVVGVMGEHVRGVRFIAAEEGDAIFGGDVVKDCDVGVNIQAFIGSV